MHKLFAIFALCCLLCSVTLFAQSADETAIAARMETLRTAMLKPDSAILTGVAADALTYVHSTGFVEDKAAFVNDLVSGKTVFTEVNFTDVSIKVDGNIACVRNRMTGAANNNNIPAKVDIIVLLVWQKQKGEWKLFARQAAKIPPPVQ